MPLTSRPEGAPPAMTLQQTPRPLTLVPAQRPPCQPWCVRHDHTEGYCHSRDIPTTGGQWSGPGYTAMSHGPAGGTLITLVHDPDAELTPDEAAQLAYAVLAQVARARGGMTRSEVQT
jgi:hypothetical protein